MQTRLGSIMKNPSWKANVTHCRSCSQLGGIPHLVDEGENGGVDRKRSLMFYDKLNLGSDKAAMRIIMCNGVWTAQARSMLPQKPDRSSVCPFCDMNVPEGLLHM